jgi:hypothetical protein
LLFWGIISGKMIGATRVVALAAHPYARMMDKPRRIVGELTKK